MLSTSRNFAAFESSRRGLARREQVATDLAKLKSRVTGWVQASAAGDGDAATFGGRHETQLRTLETVLLKVLDHLERGLEGMPLPDEGAVVHEHCRRLGVAIVWFERLWDYLRSRFDQRLGSDARSALLRAADEVIWSCYRPVFTRLAPGHPARVRSVAPLAYIEPEYSPAAVQFDRPLPAALRLVSGDATLDKMLDRLPISTLRLPPWTVNAPWWLVFVAHEVGHHLQHELGLVAHVADAMGAAAREAGLAEPLIGKWEAWGEEIFADAYAVLMIGPLAARAVAEVEWSNDAAMAQRKVHYPAPLIRIALMATMAERLGLVPDASMSLAELSSQALRQPTTAEDWQVIEGAVGRLLAPMPNDVGPLTTLCGFDPMPYAPRGKVDEWSAALRGRGTLAARSGLQDARLMASAAFSAWDELAGAASPGVEWRADLDSLVARTASSIRACAAPGKRASEALPDDASADLAALLLGAPLHGPVDEMPKEQTTWRG